METKLHSISITFNVESLSLTVQYLKPLTLIAITDIPTSFPHINIPIQLDYNT